MKYTRNSITATNIDSPDETYTFTKQLKGVPILKQKKTHYFALNNGVKTNLASELSVQIKAAVDLNKDSG